MDFQTMAYTGLITLGALGLLRYGSRIMMPFVALVLPAYKTMKAIQPAKAVVVEETVKEGFVFTSEKTIEKTVGPSQELIDAKHSQRSVWLTYWTVYGLWSIIEIATDKMLYWFPFYHEGKLIFVLWLQNGGTHIIHELLKPYFTAYESIVDSGISHVTDVASVAFGPITEAITKLPFKFIKTE